MWICMHWTSATFFSAVVIITIARIVGSALHLIYGIKKIRIPAYQFLTKAILYPSLCGLIVCISSWFIFQHWRIVDVFGLVLSGMGLFLLYFIITWMVAINSEERKGVMSKARLLFCKS